MQSPPTPFAAALVVALASSCSACASLPKGTSGAAADALAHKAEAWVNKKAWDETGAVKFSFRGKRDLLWDKQRGFLLLKMDDDRVWLDLQSRGGFAEEKGKDVVDAAEKKKLLEKAWSIFCNDTFWLNPIAKLFDQGVARELVDVDGKRALKVTYGSGGVTPGDSYVWMIDDDGRPTAVKMWVSVLPIKGMRFSWDGWTTLSTGAKVATKHAGAGMDHAVDLEDVAGAADIAALVPGDDPFARLVR